jgi:hypothetical protein
MLDPDSINQDPQQWRIRIRNTAIQEQKTEMMRDSQEAEGMLSFTLVPQRLFFTALQ